MAATVVGTINTPASVNAAGISVTFTPLDTPHAVGAVIVDTCPVTVVTTSAGALPALTLTAGYYLVSLASNGTLYGSFTILVPASGTVDLSGIITDDPPIVARQYIVLQASDGTLRKVFLVLEQGQYLWDTAPFP